MSEYRSKGEATWGKLPSGTPAEEKVSEYTVSEGKPWKKGEGGARATSEGESDNPGHREDNPGYKVKMGY